MVISIGFGKFLNWQQILKFFRLQDELVEWRIKCFEYVLFCANAIEFDALYNELMYKPFLLL